MKKYRGHLVFFAILVSYILIGIITNNYYMGTTMGRMAYSLTNPLLLIGSIFIGVGINKQKFFIPSAFIFSLMISVISYYSNRANVEINLEFITFKFVPILFIIYLSNTFVLFFQKSDITEELPIIKDTTNKIPMLQKIKNHFKTEMLFRIFIVLQILAIIFFIYYELSNNYSWNLFEDFFNTRYWTRKVDNWVFLLTFLAPYFSIKAIIWIKSSKK